LEENGDFNLYLPDTAQLFAIWVFGDLFGDCI